MSVHEQRGRAAEARFTKGQFSPFLPAAKVVGQAAVAVVERALAQAIRFGSILHE